MMEPISNNETEEAMSEIQLPNSIKDIASSFFSGWSISKILNIFYTSNPEPSTASQALIGKYSGSALCLGRPLDSVLILMSGESGSGKSSTVNALFGDKELCQTSSSSSETREVTMVRKLLRVTAESPTISGYLNFVDVPGILDTDSSHEAPNMASIRKLKTCAELTDRSNYSKYTNRIRKNVYPNVILFVVNASDNRLEGPDSRLAKSLKVFEKTAKFVDKKRSNVIVVLTHVMMMARKKEKWVRELEAKTAVIQSQFLKILGVVNVEVVPVENDPEEYDLEQSGDFYILPNGELSHGNLFEAMLRLFDNNEDLLGRMLTSWYFHGNCPEKSKPAEKINIASASNIEPGEVDIAVEALEGVNIACPQSQQNEVIPIYNFQRLAHGYCPVTEEFKSDMPLESLGKLNTVQIENSKFSIPRYVSVYKKRSTAFHRLSFMEKAEYEEHMQHKYGLDMGHKLAVSVGSNGRWINPGAGSTRAAKVSLVHEIQLATFSLSNPLERELSSGFRKELENLPDEYTPETGSYFQAFFSRWGSHMVIEQAVGGAVHVKCTLLKASMTQEQLVQVEVKVSGIFKAIFGHPEYSHSQELTELKSAGIYSGYLTVDGGAAPGILTLESATPGELRDWEKTVGQDPVELRSSIKLYPYTSYLPPGPKHQALFEATKDYLGNKLSTSIEQRLFNMRNEIADKEVTKSVEKEGNGCFPKGAMVSMDDGNSLEIEKLGETSQKLCTFEKGISSTMFCTYLDRDDEQLMEYLVLEFENTRKLVVTGSHMIFEYIHETGSVVGKQAKDFRVGESAVYINRKSMYGVEPQKLVRISNEMRLGAYAPLTTAGTLIVDGFLVSSYSDISSFPVAQAALLPMKVWCTICKLGGSSANKNSSIVRDKTQGIHPYAKFLMILRKKFGVK